jgi:asparagine synthase (glutamine-hydrolysing)
VFASELKALLAHPRVRREVDAEGLQHYLALGYVLAPRTILRDVRKLPPGEFLLATREGVRTEAYWDLGALARAPADPRPEHEQRAGFDATLDRAVERQMVSDVPLGTFLSGGLDSSTITYFARRHATGVLETFSIGFDEPSYSELAWARAAAAHLGCAHHQEAVRPPALDALGRLVWYYDEPLGDTSIIPTYHLARLARGRVTVALSGDGSDELLAGYDTYLADRFQAFYAHAPAWVRERVVRPVAAWIPSSYRKVSLDFRVKQFVENAHRSAERAHYGWRSMLAPDERRALTGSPPGDGDGPFAAYARHYDAVAGAGALNRSLYVDLKTWLADDILTKVDRASMACGLEVRVPFLAPEVVACAMRLPPALKLRGLRRKYVLKRVMRGRLPRRIVGRRKRGFNAPVSVWLRGGLGDDVDALLRERRSALVDLRSPVVERLWREHRTGAVDHGTKLWTILSLVLWERHVLT